MGAELLSGRRAERFMKVLNNQTLSNCSFTSTFTETASKILRGYLWHSIQCQ